MASSVQMRGTSTSNFVNRVKDGLRETARTMFKWLVITAVTVFVLF